MSTVDRPTIRTSTTLTENIIVAGIGIVLAAGAAVTLTMFGMFAAVVWFH